MKKEGFSPAEEEWFTKGEEENPTLNQKLSDAPIEEAFFDEGDRMKPEDTAAKLEAQDRKPANDDEPTDIEYKKAA
jgi:hypothetical protein